MSNKYPFKILSNLPTKAIFSFRFLLGVCIIFFVSVASNVSAENAKLSLSNQSWVANTLQDTNELQSINQSIAEQNQANTHAEDTSNLVIIDKLQFGNQNPSYNPKVEDSGSFSLVNNKESARDRMSSYVEFDHSIHATIATSFRVNMIHPHMLYQLDVGILKLANQVLPLAQLPLEVGGYDAMHRGKLVATDILKFNSQTNTMYITVATQSIIKNWRKDPYKQRWVEAFYSGLQDISDAFQMLPQSYRYAIANRVFTNRAFSDTYSIKLAENLAPQNASILKEYYEKKVDLDSLNLLYDDFDSFNSLYKHSYINDYNKKKSLYRMIADEFITKNDQKFTNAILQAGIKIQDYAQSIQSKLKLFEPYINLSKVNKSNKYEHTEDISDFNMLFFDVLDTFKNYDTLKQYLAKLESIGVFLQGQQYQNLKQYTSGYYLSEEGRKFLAEPVNYRIRNVTQSSSELLNQAIRLIEFTSQHASDLLAKVYKRSQVGSKRFILNDTIIYAELKSRNDNGFNFVDRSNIGVRYRENIQGLYTETEIFNFAQIPGHDLAKLYFGDDPYKVFMQGKNQSKVAYDELIDFINFQEEDFSKHLYDSIL